MLLPLFIFAIIATAGTSATKPTIVRNVSDCAIDANGILHYHGTHALTKFNHECQPWSDLQAAYPEIINEPNFFEDASIRDAKNYCRNPNTNVDGPWCFVQSDNGYDREQCAVCLSLPTRATTVAADEDWNDETTAASVNKGFWENVRDELKRVGAYIRDKFLEILERIKAKFRGSR